MVNRASTHGGTRIGLSLILPTVLGVGCAPLAERPEQAVASSDPVPAAVAQANPMPFRRPTLADLVRNSPLVFRGRVAEQAGERDPRDIIATRTTFAVDEVLIGPRETSAVTLMILGGRVGNEVMTASHMPRLEPGPTYILFADPARRTYMPITGDEHGVFIVDSAGNRVLTADSRIVFGIEGGELRLGPFLPRAGADPRSRAGGVEQPPQVTGAIIGAATTRPPEREPRAMTPEAFAAAIRALGTSR